MTINNEKVASCLCFRVERVQHAQTPNPGADIGCRGAYWRKDPVPSAPQWCHRNQQKVPIWICVVLVFFLYKGQVDDLLIEMEWKVHHQQQKKGSVFIRSQRLHKCVIQVLEDCETRRDESFDYRWRLVPRPLRQTCRDRLLQLTQQVLLHSSLQWR